MGVENNECVIATTWNNEAMLKVKSWVKDLSKSDRSLFTFIPTLTNAKETLFMAPDGSKKGWPQARHGEGLRERLIELLKTFDYEDGSNPFDWVEVGYGEYGQKVLRGNCKNMYSDAPYAE